MTEFEDYLHQRINQELRSWNPAEAHDIYLIRMYIALVNDDVRQGMLSGPDFYTTQHLKQSGDAEDEKWDSPAAYRARWMLCQPFVEAWGNADQADPEGCRLRGQHLADAGLLMTDAGLLMTDAQYQRRGKLYTKKGWNGRGGYGAFTPEDAAEEEQIDHQLDQIGQAFVDAVGAAVRRLHSDAVVREVCGPDVPIVLELSNDFDTLDAYTLSRVRQINPAGVAEDYYRFRAPHYGLSE